jgi:hypothetical protein
MACVPSNNDVVLTYTVRNPQSYNLNYDLLFSYLELPDGVTLSYTPEASREITKTDYSTFTLTLPANFLNECECGVYDISPTITVYEPKSGRYFNNYSVPIKSNSAPPVIASPVMYHTSVNNSDTYVIYFNLPGTTKCSTGICRDLSTLTINGTNYPITMSSGAISFSSSNLSVLATSATVSEDAVNFEITFTPSTDTSSAQSVRFATGVGVNNDDEVTFTITLTDDAGFSSSTVVSNKAVKIAPVQITKLDGTDIANNGSYTQDNDSYRTIKIAPPATSSDVNTSDATVVYEITRAPSSSGTYAAYASGSQVGGKTINLAPGVYKIVAHAYKSGFADSITSTITNVKVTAGKIYVDAGDSTSECYGSLDEPFTDIQSAVNFVTGDCIATTSTSAPAVISILSDVTCKTGMATNVYAYVYASYSKTSTFYLKITGKEASGGNATINTGGSTTNGGLGKRVIYATGTHLNLTLDNLTITGGYATGLNNEDTTCSGGGVYIKGVNKVTIQNCTITNNTATAAGGGIYVDNSPLVITDSKIANNTALTDGGGLRIGYNTSVSVIKFTNVVISENILEGEYANGGGLYIVGDNTCYFTNCTFTKNKAKTTATEDFPNRGAGGAVFVGNPCEFTSCTFKDNSANGSGGALLIAHDCTITGTASSPSIISGNTAENGGNGAYVRNDANARVLELSGYVAFAPEDNVRLEDSDDNFISVIGELGLPSGYSSMATITPEIYDEGTKVVQGSGIELTQDICDKFAVTSGVDTSYCVICNDKKEGVIRKSGISIPTINDVTLKSSFTGGTSTETDTGYKLTISGLSVSSVITLNTTAKNADGIELLSDDLNKLMTNRKIELYFGEDLLDSDTTTTASDECSLPARDFYVGTYLIKMSATINGVDYSRQVTLIVTN